MADGGAFMLGVVILAAGNSSRMGQPKLLLSWGDTTVLGQLIAQWTRLGAAQIAVVGQVTDAALWAELDRLNFPAAGRIVNPKPERGMFSSIQCAAGWDGWKPDLTFVGLALGDQPHLRPGTLEKLAGFARENAGRICQPGKHGHGRHPVLLPPAIFKQLAHARQETLKEFLGEHSAVVRLVELDDPGLELDIDRPEDFQRAREMFFGRTERGSQ